MRKQANRILFCHTDLIVTQLYSQRYLGVVPEILYALEKQITYHKHFFFDIDVPWIADGLRDLADERESMREIFLNELEKRNIKPVIVRGSFEHRDQIIKKAVDDLL
jgi:nicotinamide riboside kinase